jgi:AP-4 complex subunit mu-1
MLILLAKVPYHGLHCRASFELEAGAVGQTTDFKEGSRRLEWNLKKASQQGYVHLA